MPVYSGQIGGMISQQNQMFSGVNSYAAGFSPGGPPGMPSWGGPNATFEEMPFTAGTSAMGAAHSIMPAAIGAGIMAGSFLPGRIGSAIGRMDPFQAALSGFGRASGVTSGIAGQGIMDSIGTMGANIGKIGAGGFGNVVRAGIAGVGGAAMAAAVPMAAFAGASYLGGQMMEGAQYTQQVQQSLSHNFRFMNPQSASGRGFSREQGKDIADTLREMGGKDIMSSSGEMLRLMEGGIQGGMFKAVQDAKEFKSKFKKMTESLKEIAKTFNTTMEGAMPFLTEARRMGFWTPSDVMRLASPTQAAAINSGQSVAQVQAMQQQGAAMARQVGAAGTAGAVGMTNVVSMMGGAVRSGAISEKWLSEATGGLQGSEAINAMSGQLQAGATRFASSRQARWLLAAAANKDMTGLDAGKLGLLTSGRMGVNEIRGMAESNIQGRGAEFVMGEQDMRGDLLKMGIEGQAGFMKGIVGKHLYGDSSMSQLITRRLVQRYMGGDAKQADMMAQIMRNLPQIKRDNMRRSDAERDQQDRDQDTMMNHSYEGFKRKAASSWEHGFKEPWKQIGSDISNRIGNAWENFTDSVWNRAPRGLRSAGYSESMLDAEQAGVMGNNRAYHETFASRKEMEGLNSNFKSRELGTLGANGRMLLKQTQGSMTPTIDVPEGAILVGNKIMMPGGATRGDLVKMQVASMKKLADLTGGSSSDMTDLLKGDNGEKVKRAMTKMSMAAQEKDPKKKAELTTAAKALLGEAAAGERNESNREMLHKLKNGGPEVEAELAKAGDQQRGLNTIDSADVLKKRMDRVNLDDLSGLDDYKGEDGKSLGLGAALKGIVTEGRGGKMTGREANEKLAEVAKTLAKMGTSNEARAKVASVMQTLEKAGFGMGAAALSGAEDIMDVTHAFGAKGSMHEKVSSLSNISGALGLSGKGGSPFTKEVVQGLLSGGGKLHDKAIAKLTAAEEGMSDEKKEHLRKLTKAVQGGDMATLVGEAGAGGMRSGVSALANANRKERIDANLVGKKGSMDGVHEQLSIQTGIQKAILIKMGAPDPDTETPNPKDDNMSKMPGK